MSSDALPPLVEMDCYDAIEIVAARPDAPSRLLGENARRVADLWNDPEPYGSCHRDWVREANPELADALDELLGGGPSS
jgi:hypothetical protein